MSDADSAGSNVRQEMRNFIEDNFLYMQPDVELGDGDHLLEKGIVDSLGFVEIVEEVEARFGVRVQDVDITEDNFGSIESIARYVESKRAGS